MDDYIEENDKNDLSTGPKVESVNNLSKNDLSYNSQENNNEKKNNLSTSYNNSLLLNEELVKDANGETRDFKVILLGNESVGKTSIFNKFTTGEYSNEYRATLTVEFRPKLLKLSKNLYAKLTIWDTVGSEKYRSITKQYFHGANGLILIYDLTDIKTFKNLESWIKDIKEECDENIVVYIIGNKNDLEEQRSVNENQIKDFRAKYDYKYFETSAKEGTNILVVFEQLSMDMNFYYEKQKEEYLSSQVLSRPSIDEGKGKDSCC